MRRLLCFGFLFFVVGLSIALPQANSEKNNAKRIALEKELLKLKNNAFCNLFYRSLRDVNGEITPPDGSSYVQIINLSLDYLRNPYLDNILNKWSKKVYKSYDPEDKLYLMRCLDFYNSKDLELYIDSVRQIELKKIR